MSTQVMRAAYPITSLSAVAGLAIVMTALEPDTAIAWIGAGLMLPLAWFVIEVILGKRSDEVRRSIYFASFLLFFPLLFSMGASLELYDPDDRSFASAALGFLMGGVLIFMGNYIPKRLPDLDEEKYDPAKVLAIKRFAGWAFVLAGMGYILAWLILPTTPANIVATGLCLLATAMILGRRALARLRS
jgi:hypothetical protein